MRTFVALLVVAVLGWLFLRQKDQAPQNAATKQSVALQAASPRPVSEHNWAKHALDKTNKVTRDVAAQRKANATP